MGRACAVCIHESNIILDIQECKISSFIKENKDKLDFTDKEIEFIVGVISSHMGPWNTNNYSNTILPKPNTSHQRFVHMCDYLASRKFLNVEFEGNNIVR